MGSCHIIQEVGYSPKRHAIYISLRYVLMTPVHAAALLSNCFLVRLLVFLQTYAVCGCRNCHVYFVHVPEQ